MHRDEILQHALALSPHDRIFLLERVGESLAQGGDFASDELAQAWTEEVERRIDAYDSGETTAEDWDVAFARMTASLAARRKS